MGNGQGKERPVDVSHIGNGSFEMSEKGKATDLLDFDKKKEELGKDDWHEVIFKLHDNSGALRFHPDPRQAIWVARGDASSSPPCPGAVSSDPQGEFKGVDVSPDGKRLFVHNTNETRCELSFRLNFVDAKDTSANPMIVAFHDPMVSNKNGSFGG